MDKEPEEDEDEPEEDEEDEDEFEENSDEEPEEDEEPEDLTTWMDVTPAHEKRKHKAVVILDPSFSKQRKGCGAVPRDGLDGTDMNFKGHSKIHICYR